MTPTKSASPAAQVTLQPAIADRLLDLLSTDNNFRRAFKKDPATALLHIGHVPAMQDATVELAWLRASLSVERLASKECIAKSRAEIRRMLTQGLAMIPIQLNATSNSSFVSRESVAPAPWHPVPSQSNSMSAGSSIRPC